MGDGIVNDILEKALAQHRAAEARAQLEARYLSDNEQSDDDVEKH